MSLHPYVILTVRHFNADLAANYRLLYMPTLLMFLTGAGVYVS